jgi:hypothetical protein
MRMKPKAKKICIVISTIISWSEKEGRADSCGCQEIQPTSVWDLKVDLLRGKRRFVYVSLASKVCSG